MTKFKVGDRVASTMYESKGMSGRVIFIGNGPCNHLVEFDRPFQRGHTGVGKGKAGHCYWCFAEYLTPLSDLPQTIVIHQSGPVTKALLKEGKTTIRTAEAKCSPSDTYDFAVGARIAFERLMGEVPVTTPRPDEKPAQEPIKLYCVKPLSGWLTVGKTHESVDGWITVNSGGEYVDFVMRREGYLVPLVKRRAKVGEWVYATFTNPELYRYGEVSRVIKTDTDETVMITGDKRYPHGRWISDSRYLVLDGYKGPDAL